jgi:nucleoid DNA-binding protein
MTNIELLQSQFPGKVMLSKKQVAQILNISQSTLNRALASNELAKIPKFKRFGRSEKAPYQFSIVEVAKFLSSED